MNNTYLSKTMV